MTSRRSKLGQEFAIMLLFLGFVLLVCSSCGGTGSSGGNPCDTDPTSAECANQSDLRIDVGSAPQMRIHDSQVIKVVLHSLSGMLLVNDSLPQASVPAENATVTTAPVNPVGTPDAPLATAFGPGYKAVASATLTTTGPFKITPLAGADKPQSLDQTSIEWRWLVTAMATETSTQILDVDIEVTWNPLSKSLPQQGSVSIGNQQISIQITTVSNPTPTPTPTLAPTLTPSPTLVPTPTVSNSSNGSNSSNNNDNSGGNGVIDTLKVIGAIIVALATVITAITALLKAFGKIMPSKKKD